MENNLVQRVKSYFTEEVLSSLSVHVGEDKEYIKSGVNVAIPSILLGLQSHADRGLHSILTQSKHLFGGFAIGNVFGKFFGSGSDSDNTQFESENILNSVFNDRFGVIAESVSKVVGIKTESIKTIFGAVLPAVISTITNKGGNWDSASISGILQAHKSEITSALPAGLGLGAFGAAFAKADIPVEIDIPKSSGVNTEATFSEKPPQPTVVHTNEAVTRSKRSAGLWWILVPIILIGLWFLFGRGCSGSHDTAVLHDSLTKVHGPDTVDTMSQAEQSVATPELIDVELPDGKKIKVYPSGIEEELLAFLRGDYRSLTDEQLKNKWFNFDHLNFESGTAKILPESQSQLENLAKILTLFPDLKIKIGGYTDRTGNEEINERVSQERADAVKDYLVSNGLSKQVVGAEGYGSKFAVASADAPESERVRDRRVAISLRR